MVLLVIDEMDQLDSKHQEVLYTIFEWPSIANSRLVLIGKSHLSVAILLHCYGLWLTCIVLLLCPCLDVAVQTLMMRFELVTLDHRLSHLAQKLLQLLDSLTFNDFKPLLLLKFFLIVMSE